MDGTVSFLLHEWFSLIRSTNKKNWFSDRIDGLGKGTRRTVCEDYLGLPWFCDLYNCFHFGSVLSLDLFR